MKTRKDLMNGLINHHNYYSQFVNIHMINYVVNSIGRERLLSSTDEHLNDIQLKDWDCLTDTVRNMITNKGDWVVAASSTYSKEQQDKKEFLWSLSDGICLAKTAAKIFIENNKKG